MKWALALSFSQPDLDVAAHVASYLSQRNVGVYCYTQRFVEQVGLPIFITSEAIYRDALRVAVFLRADYLERPFTTLEYRVALERLERSSATTAFFAMESGARYLVPASATAVFDLAEVSAENLLNQCASAILDWLGISHHS